MMADGRVKSDRELRLCALSEMSQSQGGKQIKREADARWERRALVDDGRCAR